MPSPRASAVVVALSTLVAVTTVSAALSQLAPAERAGALLPVAPITTGADPSAVDPAGPDDVDAGGSDETVGTPTPGTGTGTGTGTGQTPATGESTEAVDATPGESVDDGTTVVEPAPAEPVGPEPPASTPPGNNGNNGNGPGNNNGNGPGSNNGNGPGNNSSGKG